MAGVVQESGSGQSGLPRPGSGQSKSHIVALLSLKILLLAFFILLNSLASFEDDRRMAVVDSVRQAFLGTIPASINTNSSPAALDVLDGAEKLIEELHRLFSDELPLVERRDSPDSVTLRIDLPVADLFVDKSNELLPEGAETLRLIAGILSDPRFANVGYRVDVLYGLAGEVSGLDGNRATLARAGALVREMERQGLPAGQLSTGFLPGFEGQVRFHFTIATDVTATGGGD